MKYTVLASALALDLAKTEITLCVEEPSMDTNAAAVVAALNSDTALLNDFTFTFLSKSSQNDVISAFVSGACNMVKFDAIKAYVLSVADKGAFPIAQESGGQ